MGLVDMAADVSKRVTFEGLKLSKYRFGSPEQRSLLVSWKIGTFSNTGVSLAAVNEIVGPTSEIMAS